MEDVKLTLVEHLEELRRRLIKSVIFIVIASCLVYNFSNKILSYLVKPVGKVVFLSPAEAFMADLKIGLFGGLFVSSPFVIYQIWKFVSAGLNRNERKYALLFGPVSFIFFITGASFGYFIIIPIGLKFLLGYATEFMTPMIRVTDYISFIGGLSLAFGAVFELPLIILFLAKIGVVNTAFLSSKRRHAIVIIFIVAAALTPPDLVSQFLMAVPLIILYEVGIIFSRFARRKT